MEQSATRNDNKPSSSSTSNILKLFYKLGAECYFAKGNYQECIPIILEALKFNPDDPEIWCIYAKVFIVKKAFEYAKPLLKKAINLDPGYKEAIDLLAILEKDRSKK
jgi:tetratricopeptide (TPR) repeat protein